MFPSLLMAQFIVVWHIVYECRIAYFLRYCKVCETMIRNRELYHNSYAHSHWADEYAYIYHAVHFLFFSTVFLHLGSVLLINMLCRLETSFSNLRCFVLILVECSWRISWVRTNFSDRKPRIYCAPPVLSKSWVWPFGMKFLSLSWRFFFYLSR